MFLVRTRVGPSQIHGTGVFADENVPAGTLIWRFDPIFDCTFSQADFDAASPAVQAFLMEYAYRAIDLQGRWVLSGDHARFLNHSDYPNTGETRFESLATEDIGLGDEITCNYSAFCENWSIADLKNAVDPSLAAPPHRNLHTRLGPAQYGVGVFAIHDIPEGTALFTGDNGATINVPVALVDQIADEAVKQMYLDFCPEVEGSLIAPSSFNQLTMGWYLNHSETPNVAASDGLRFSTLRLILAGEELTTNYATYSQSAERLIPTWEA